MKMVLLSDLHLGRYKYGKIETSGIDTRTNDILENIQKALDYANDNDIKTIAILGDFYHTKRPPQLFRRLLVSKFEWALSKGITLYLLLGNHDQGKTHGHDLVELVELSSQIKNLHVIEMPTIIEQEDSLLCFLPHVNIFDFNIAKEEFHDYIINKVKDMEKEAKKLNKKFNYFFGHFGTDKSFAGKSFDMGGDEKCSRILPLEIFDKAVWTRVYLGDIHKQQELNEVCKHVGSIAKVDFGEEGEEKGFYFVDGENDKFITIVNDREFKTLTIDFTKNDDLKETVSEFYQKTEKIKTDESIVRLRVILKEKNRKLINFNEIDDFLKSRAWNYIGKTFQEIKEEKQEIRLEAGSELNYMSLFRDYLSKLNADDKENLEKCGEEILKEVQ
jgi:exonuclease SbcD